jgi:hypothetical protein
MAFTLGSQFNIGAYKFKGCNDLKITKTIHDYVQKAVIKLPTSAVLKCDEKQTESVQTAKTFNVGDKVSIQLGYNGDLKQEFVGFISNINFITPVEIECEGYSWQLRRKTNIKKSWASTTLQEVLQEVVSGTDIKLHPDIPDMPLKNIVINNGSGTQVLDYIKSLLKGALTAFFIDDTLYMGLSYYDTAHVTTKYQLGWNTIDANDLKFKRAADTVINIEMKYRDNTGQLITTNQGKKGGAVRTDTISVVSSSEQLTKIAKAKLLQESFDGYEGTFTAFLVPYCQAGYRCELTDKRYPERSGNYYIESTETTYGMGGARRKVGIGLKLS